MFQFSFRYQGFLISNITEIICPEIMHTIISYLSRYWNENSQHSRFPVCISSCFPQFENPFSRFLIYKSGEAQYPKKPCWTSRLSKIFERLFQNVTLSDQVLIKESRPKQVVISSYPIEIYYFSNALLQCRLGNFISFLDFHAC